MSLPSMYGLAYDVGAAMKNVPRTTRAPAVRRYEDQMGSSYQAGHPQRIARPSVLAPPLPRVYEDALGGSYKATPYPQRIVRPSLSAMRRG